MIHAMKDSAMHYFFLLLAISCTWKQIFWIAYWHIKTRIHGLIGISLNPQYYHYKKTEGSLHQRCLYPKYN